MDTVKLLNGHLLTQPVEQTQKQGLIMNEAKVYRELKVIKASETSDHKDLLEDHVVYVGKRNGTEVEIEGTPYVIVHEREVMMVI